MRRQETHDETIARLWDEIEQKRLADLEAQFAPKPAKAPEPRSLWVDVADGVAQMSIEPRPGARMIHGIASSSSLNSHGYALIAHGMDAKLPVPLLSSHKGHSAPIGEVFFIRRSEDRVYVRALLYDHEAADFAWKLIESGEVRQFSGAAEDASLKLQGIVSDKTFYGRWTLREVSITPRGANPDAAMEPYEIGAGFTKFFARPIADRAPTTKPVFKQTDPAIPYQGVWQEAEQYQRGQFATAGGALWHAEIASKGVKPGTAPGIWRLAVKRGEAGKLEKAQ